MKFNKREFLKSELGTEIKNCIDFWDKAVRKNKIEKDDFLIKRNEEQSLWCQAQW